MADKNKSRYFLDIMRLTRRRNTLNWLLFQLIVCYDRVSRFLDDKMNHHKKNFLALVIFASLLTSCSTRRDIAELETEQKERISGLQSEAKLCQLREIEELDDGNTNIEYVTELVMWKCSKYYEIIKDVLYQEYDVELGQSWVYANDLRQTAPKEITEAIVLRRKLQAEKTDSNAIFKRQQ